MLAAAEAWQSLPSRRDGQQDPNWVARLLSWLSRPDRPTGCLALLVRLLSCAAAARDSAEEGHAVLHVLNVGSQTEWRGLILLWATDEQVNKSRLLSCTLAVDPLSGSALGGWMPVTRSGGWVRAGSQCRRLPS